IGVIGMVAGFVVYAGIVLGVAAVVREQTGVVIQAWVYSPVMWSAPLGMIALCALGGMVPAFVAYRTDVAGNLSPSS
ncbi:MAG TPA: ABC transporter permease, partial [Opitutaceae bacterium]|nr:ABC transporter permease [Opitutaceae bacterium]